jgi:hypothetical protein
VPPPAFPHHGLRRISAAPALLAGERPSIGSKLLSRATVGGSHSPSLNWPSVVVFWDFFFCCFFGFLFYLDYCLLLGETLIFEFVLVLFFSVVSILDFYSAFTTSASFG